MLRVATARSGTGFAKKGKKRTIQRRADAFEPGKGTSKSLRDGNIPKDIQKTGNKSKGG